MATDRQIAANQRNALNSTGPRSLAGKQRSSQNAIKHGLTAKKDCLPGEDPDEFEGLRQAMFKSLNPQGALENQLAERAASLIWRMRRIEVFELALFQWTAYLQRQIHDAEGEDIHPRNDPFPDEDLNHELSDKLHLGRMFEVLLSTDQTGKLTRYETNLQNLLGQTLKELRAFKDSRDIVSKLVDERLTEKEEEYEKEYREQDSNYLRGKIGPP